MSAPEQKPLHQPEEIPTLLSEARKIVDVMKREEARESWAPTPEFIEAMKMVDFMGISLVKRVVEQADQLAHLRDLAKQASEAKTGKEVKRLKDALYLAALGGEGQ